MPILTKNRSGHKRAGLIASLGAVVIGVALVAAVLINVGSPTSTKSPQSPAKGSAVPPLSAAQTAKLIDRFGVRIQASNAAPSLTEPQAISYALSEMPFSGTIQAGSLVVATLPGENAVPRLDWLLEVALNPTSAPRGHGPPPDGSASASERPRSNFAAVLVDATTGDMAGAFDGYDPQLPPLPTSATGASITSPTG